MQPKPKQKPCARCGKARDANGRYCRQCRATYMRKWRKRHVVVSRETYERLMRTFAHAAGAQTVANRRN